MKAKEYGNKSEIMDHTDECDDGDILINAEGDRGCIVKASAAVLVENRATRNNALMIAAYFHVCSRFILFISHLWG